MDATKAILHPKPVSHKAVNIQETLVSSGNQKTGGFSSEPKSWKSLLVVICIQHK